MPGQPISQLLESAARLHKSGDPAQAHALCLEALQQDPNRLDLLRLTSRLAFELGDFGQSADLLNRAVWLRPNEHSLRVNLGTVLINAGRVVEAIATLREAVRLRPDSLEALSNLGAALRQHGDFDESASVLQHALALRPDHPQALVNFGAVLTNLERFDDAIAALQTAVSLHPKDELAHYNLGIAYKSAGRYDDAINSLNRVVALRPTHVDAITNIGDVLHETSRYDQAIASFNAALAIAPEDPAARTNLSFAMLLKGEYAKAWPLYESRRKISNQRAGKTFTQPLWDGTPLPGQRILLHWEQGLGDTLQFIRYAAMVAERGLEVLLLCQKELRRLLIGQCGISHIYTDGETLPPFDVHCPLLSLPSIFQTTLDTIPNKVPYLFPDPDLQSRWRSKVDPYARVRIGLNWAGSALPLSNRKRTVGLAAFAPLGQIQGAEFYSLQKGPPSSQAVNPPPGMKLVDLSAEITDYADTAALMWCLDMVITCDTSIAHAAGALGIKTHVLLPFNPDWRWHLQRDDSPWYPTLRLHRQPAPGDYNTPIRELAAQLAQMQA